MWLLKAPPELSGPSGLFHGHQVIQGHVLVDNYDSFYWLKKKGFVDITPDPLRPLYTPPENLLIIRHGGIGDMMVVSAVARAVKKTWPGCRISLACTTTFADLFLHNPDVSLIIRNWLMVDCSRNTSDFDDTFDFTHSVEFNAQAQLDDYYSRALKLFGLPVDPNDPPKPCYYITNAEKDQARKRLQEMNVLGPRKRLIGLSLRATVLPRSLSYDRILEIVDYFAAQPDVELLLYGDTLPMTGVFGFKCSCGYASSIFLDKDVSSLEKTCPKCKAVVKVTEEARKTWPNVHNFGTTLPIRESAATLGFLDALVSVDTGMAHIAAAFAIPQLLLTSSWDGYCPAGTFPNTRILQKPYACAPCFSHINICRRMCLPEITHPPCMNEFTPQEVWEQLQIVLENRNTYQPVPTTTLKFPLHNLGMQRPCPYCKNTKFTGEVKARKGPYAYHICPNCKSLLVNRLPTKEEALTVYNDPLFEAASRDPKIWEGCYNVGKQFEEHVRRLVLPKMAPGSVLELGMGVGRHLQAFVDAGWEAHGVEASGPQFKIAKEECKITNAYQADVQTLTPVHPRGLPDRKVSVIDGKLTVRANSMSAVVLGHVLEHLTEDPYPFLKKIMQVLMPRGVLVLAVPYYDVKTIPEPMLWIHINTFVAGEHVSIPSQDALKLLLDAAGLVPKIQLGQQPDSTIVFAQKLTMTPLDPTEGAPSGDQA